MKKENYVKQDFTVSNLAQKKNVSLPLSFFNKCSISKLRDLSEISRGGGGGNFKFGFGNEVTQPCNGSEIC